MPLLFPFCSGGHQGLERLGTWPEARQRVLGQTDESIVFISSAARTKDHQLDGFTQQKVIVSQSWRLEVPKQGVGRTVLPRSLRKGCFLASSRLWELQASGSSQLSYLQSPPPSSQGFCPSVSSRGNLPVHLCPSPPFSSCKDTSQTALRSALMTSS